MFERVQHLEVSCDSCYKLQQNRSVVPRADETLSDVQLQTSAVAQLIALKEELEPMTPGHLDTTDVQVLFRLFGIL